MKQAKKAVVLFVCACYLLTFHITAFAQPEIIQKEKSLSSQNGVYKASYPLIHGLNNQHNQLVLNTIFEEMAKKAVKQLKLNNLKSNKIGEVNGLDYEVTFLNNGIISLRFNDYSRSDGIKQISSFTVLEKTGKQLTISELFLNNSDYENLIKNQLVNNELSDEQAINLTKNISSFENFYFDNENLVLIYDNMSKEIAINKKSIETILIPMFR